MIRLSPSAAKEIQRWQKSRQQTEGYFRLSVKSGGCSGLYYSLEWGQTPQSDDRLYESQEIPILVDVKSDRFLQNLAIDYAEDLMGGGFRFQNTNATAICGCGLSFRSSEIQELQDFSI